MIALLALARERLEALGTLATPCDACGTVEWRIADRVAAIWERVEGAEVVEAHDDGPGSRVLPVVCTHCGNTRFHDWRLLTGRRDA